MKKMTIIAVAMLVAVFANAATLNWGTGTTKLLTNDGSANLDGYVALMVYSTTAGDFVAVDQATISTAAKGGGTASGVWNSSDVPAYLVADFPAGTDFYMAVYQNGNVNPMNLYNGGGVNSATPSYWQTTAVTDADAAGSAALDTSGFGGSINFTPVPEPTSMALIALGVAALSLRRKRS